MESIVLENKIVLSLTSFLILKNIKLEIKIAILRKRKTNLEKQIVNLENKTLLGKIKHIKTLKTGTLLVFALYNLLKIYVSKRNETLFLSIFV